MDTPTNLTHKVKPKEWDIMGKITPLTLDLSNKHLTQLPKELFELQDIEALDLTNNKNIDLSNELIKLTNLKVLCLDGCNLNTVPTAVTKLPQLEMLILSNNKNITLPDEMSSLINLTALGLVSCDLDTLPPVVLKLGNLQELDLSSNDMQISLPDELYKLENIKVLRLKHCNLATVPPAVLRLPQLEELDLSGNSGIHLPDELSELNIRVLKLRRTDMVTVPPVVWRLTYVKHLDLSGCELHTLPPDLWRLTQLEWLDMSFNPLQTLPSEIGELNNVKHLDLSDCELRTLPPEVWRLTQLEWLDLSSNPLQTLPAGVGQLTNVKHLDLSGCELHTLPPEVWRLARLEWLDLNFNPLQTLPVEIGHLTNVKHLDLFLCQLHTLPPEVWRLTQLEWLDLRSNPLQTLPVEIGHLTNVKHLGLSLCQLHTLPPEVGRLTQLEWLDLSHNSLQALPTEIAQLTNTRHLNVTGNPLIKPPAEVCRQGIVAIRQYFHELERSEEDISAHLKVVVLGEKMTGKTSLVQTLSSGVSTLTDEEDRTHCVEITQCAPDDNITFEVYDFGGSDVYHLTHQFFLTQGALNLLTVNLHTYSCSAQSYTEAVGFWLDTLNARVPGAVVTIVGSKSDMCSGAEIEDKTRDIQERFTQQHETCNWRRAIQQQIKKLQLEREANGGTDQGEIEQQLERTRQLLTRPLRLTGVLCVSSAEPTSGLNALRSHIMDTANNTSLFPTLRRILPRTWVHFEKQLHDLRERPNVSSDSGYRLTRQSSLPRYRVVYRPPTQSSLGSDCVYRSSASSNLGSDSDYFSLPSSPESDPGYSASTQSIQTSSDSGYTRSSTQSSHTGSDSGYITGSSTQRSYRRQKWLTGKDCMTVGQLAGLSTDKLEPVLSYLQQVGTILRYTDIPELKDLVFHDPSCLIDVMKLVVHHDLKMVFTNKNPRLEGFSNTKLKRIRKNLSSRGYLPREVFIALLGPHATPVGNVDVITNLMEHFGLCYTEWSDEQDGETSTSTPVGYCIPWYIQEERPRDVKRGIRKRQKKGFTVACEIAGFCPRGLFERLSVVVNKLIKSRQNWKYVIVAVRDSLPVIVYRETKYEHVNIVVKLSVPAQAVDVPETQVIRDAIGPLKDKLSALLNEWPGLLYHLVYSTTQQGKQKGDPQTLSVSSIIPTFEVGPGGCTVQHGGVTLEFPEGCVRDTRFISVEVEAVPVNEDVRTNFTAMSAVLTVEQDFPQRFLRPVTVRLPWVWTQSGQKNEDTTETVVLHYSREDGWTVFLTDVQEGPETVVFQTDRFQSYVVKKVKDVCTEIAQLWGFIWNGYCEDKVYLIVMPNKVFLPDRFVNLLCVHKQDDPSEFFSIGYVSKSNQVKQRISMTNQERIRAYLHTDFDLQIDPRDIPPDGLIFEFPDPPADRNRYSVAVETTAGVPEKDIYEGRISFERLDLKGNVRDVAARRIANLPIELHRKFQGATPGTTADVVSQQSDTSLRQRPTSRHQQQAWPDEHSQQPARPERTASSPPRQQRRKPNFPITVIVAVAMIVYLLYSVFRLVPWPGGGGDAPQNDNSTQRMDLWLLLTFVAVLVAVIFGIWCFVFRKGPKVPIILLLNDEYGTSKGGISTINCQLGQILKDNAVVYCTALRVPEQDQKAADRDGVQLKKPNQLGQKTEPTLDWLTYYHSVHFPDLPQDVTCIIGHADITDTAARNFKDQRYPQADLIMFTHVIPEDTEYYKGGRKAMKAREKERDMLNKVDNAKAAFSVGKRIYIHFANKYRGKRKPKSHFVFLPRPSGMFLATPMTPGGEQKVVLSIGRVRKVEKLKGHDLAGEAMGKVVNEVENVCWDVRGISEDDYETSKKILEEALNSNKIKPNLMPYGTQEDIREDMMTAHLVLMPSRSEPFGLVGLEAIAAGIPVLISDKTGLSKMILDLIQQGKLSPEHRNVIVETSVNDRDRAGDIGRWARKIVDVLQYSDSEFEKAARFKRELEQSRYWEESHNTFLRACGIKA